MFWFARRLHRGATFGRKTSFVVRSLLPLLLGFGGWCLGVLIALVALPTVPITDGTLAVFAIAPPVALAVYVGWFRPTGFGRVAAVAALAAATLGAWLGFRVRAAPGFGAVTAIISAILAANLGLIALDLAAPATVDVAVPGSQGPRQSPAPSEHPTRLQGKGLRKRAFPSFHALAPRQVWGRVWGRLGRECRWWRCRVGACRSRNETHSSSKEELTCSAPSTAIERATSARSRRLLRPPAYGHSRNLAARMGRWSAAHWKTATFGWLAFVIVAFASAASSARRASTRTRPGRASPAASTGSSTPASSSPPARAS